MGLSCDVCGGTDFIKSGDYFKCENCGMKYSLESIRAMTSNAKQESPADSGTSEASEAEDQTSEASDACGDMKSPSEEGHTVHQPEVGQADTDESSDELPATNSQREE